MNTQRIVIGYLVLLIVLFTFAGCGSTSRQASTGEYIDDSVITTKVKSRLAEDDFLKSFKISVETYKGAVQLSGFVNTQEAVEKRRKRTNRQFQHDRDGLILAEDLET